MNPTHLEMFDYVLAPSSFHQGYLLRKHQDWQRHYQLITKEQFCDDVFGKIDRQKVLPLIMRGFACSAQEANDILSSLSVDPTQLIHTHPYLDRLQRVYRYLSQEGLIRLNPLHDVKYHGKTIYIDGYHNEDCLINELVARYQMVVTYAPTPPMSEGKQVFRFESIEDEVSYFFNQVATLIQQGVPLKDIYLRKPAEHYVSELNRQSTYFQIPIQLTNQDTLFTLPITQWYLQKLKEGIEDEGIWKQSDSFPAEDVTLLKQTLLTANVSYLAPHQRATYLRYVCQHTRLQTPRYVSAVQVITDAFPLPDHHVFVLGFVQGRYPTITRDLSLLPESLQQALGWLTTAQENALQRHSLHCFLARTNHLYLSYARIEQGQIMTVSPMVTTLGMKELAGEFVVNHTDYSGQLGLLRREKYRYIAQRFRYQHPLLEAYETQFKEVIKPFDYAFESFDVGLKEKALTLSYSAIKDYYSCGFKYYVSRVLKVKPIDQDEFYMHLGTFAHEVFEKVEDRLASFEEVFTHVLSQQINLSEKEKVLFSHLKKQLYQVCEFNVYHQHAMAFAQRHVEAKMDLTIDEQTKMIGYIDKIVELQDAQGQRYLAVVDYKSGSESFDETLIPYGWSLQLPMYAWMLNQHPDFKDKPVLGVFIQHIVETSFGAKTLTIDSKTFPKSYQLDGIALGQMKEFTLLDRTIGQGTSTFIGGVSLIKSGDFKKSKRVKTRSDFQHYTKEAHDKIITANQKIRAGEFVINPKSIKQKQSCDHCPFLDTCFRQPKDIEVINLAKQDEGDDSDA